MDDHSKKSTSLYDYTDKSVPHAGIADIVYAVILVGSLLLAFLQAKLYGDSTPSQASGGGLPPQNDELVRRAPALSITIFDVALAVVSVVLALGIFKRSKTAIALMLVIVIGLQLYTWLIAHSLSGTIPSVVVGGFLVRGAARIFERRDEHDLSTTPKV